MPGELTAALSTVCYSLSFVLLRKGQAESNPRDHGLLPILFVSTLTFLSALLFHYLAFPTAPERLPISPRAIRYAVASGLFGTLFGRLALYTAIDYLGATRGVVIKALSPLATLLLAIIFLKEHYEKEYAIGMIFLFLGVGFILIERTLIKTRSISSFLFRHSFVIAALAAFLQGTGHAFRKLSVLAPVSPLWMASIDMFAAFIGYIILLVVRGELSIVWNSYRGQYNLPIYTAGVMSASGVLLFFLAVSQIPVSEVSIILGAEPIIVALISSLFLRQLERMTWLTIAAAVCVASGVMVISL